MNHSTLLQLPPLKLLTHDGHIEMPLSQERFAALKASIATHGIQRPLAVMASGDRYTVLAGYNRWQCALQLELATVPCVLVADLDDPIRYMLDDNVTGRPCTKSAIALQVFLYHKESLLAETAKERQFSGKKEGGLGLNPNGETLGISANCLAEQYDFDYHLLLDLESIYRSFGCCETPEGLDDWKLVCRAILEDEASIPRLKAGVAGAATTKGLKKAAVKYDNLGVRSTTSLVTCFQNWAKIKSQDVRTCIGDRLCEALRVLPPEGFDALAAAADSWNEHECKRLQQALRERLAGMK